MKSKNYKRHNECAFCSSRRCHEHIYTTADNGNLFNELACRNHVDDLYTLAQKTIPNGVVRSMTSSTGDLSRRDIEIHKAIR